MLKRPNLGKGSFPSKRSFYGVGCIPSCFIMMKSTLIIGNGFDLDVGMKTTYSDYAKSSWWPFRNARMIDGCETLAYTLKQRAGLDKWFDVEEIIYEYACKESIQDIHLRKLVHDSDMRAFQQLNEGLVSYLKDVEADLEPKGKPMAIRVLESFLEKPGEKTIYSFNYTDLRWIAQRYEVFFDRSVPCEYVHGSIGPRQIILGVGANRDLADEYIDFYKTSSPHYDSSNIFEDMPDSDELIIFGHSLGTNDYPYFEPFLRKASSIGNDTFKRRKVRIYTRSDESRKEIERHLRHMIKSGVTMLKNLNDFKIVTTENCIW